MFPIGKYTSLCQASGEAEEDVSALLLAARTVEPQLKSYVMKYVAVAVLAFKDILSKLSGEFMKAHLSWLPKEEAVQIQSHKKRFERAATDQQIESRLRNFVRNLVSAHRSPQTGHSSSQTHQAIHSKEFPELFNSAKVLLQQMEAVPVWTWGSSVYEGGIEVIRCTKMRTHQPIAGNEEDGFQASLYQIEDLVACIEQYEEKKFSVPTSGLINTARG